MYVHHRCLLLDFMVLWKERDSLTYALVLEWTRFAKMLQQVGNEVSKATFCSKPTFAALNLHYDFTGSN
jgi:hypothetical protein